MHNNWLFWVGTLVTFVAAGQAAGQEFSTSTPSFVDSQSTRFTAMSPDSWSQPAALSEAFTTTVSPSVFARYQPNRSRATTNPAPNISQSSTVVGSLFVESAEAQDRSHPSFVSATAHSNNFNHRGLSYFAHPTPFPSYRMIR